MRTKTISIHHVLIMEAFEPPHEISNNVVCAIRKDLDQPAHMCSPIRAFASCLNILFSVKLLTEHNLAFVKA